jgi:hypothetical protein
MCSLEAARSHVRPLIDAFEMNWARLSMMA